MVISLPDARDASDELVEDLSLQILHGCELGLPEAADHDREPAPDRGPAADTPDGGGARMVRHPFEGAAKP